MKFLKVAPLGHEDIASVCASEDEAERIRLMYVGLTRARDLLVVPAIDKRDDVKAWSDLVDVKHDGLPMSEAPPSNAVSRVVFDNGEAVSEAAHRTMLDKIKNDQITIKKRVPSNHEIHVAYHGDNTVFDFMDAVPNLDPFTQVSGSAERGNILHKLMEEIITGEITVDDLSSRAYDLIRQVVASVPADGVIPELHLDEIVATVLRTVSIPEIATILPDLVAEVGISSSSIDGSVETLTLGVADAVLPKTGSANDIDMIVDWKGDLRPSDWTLSRYVDQVRSYMKIRGVPSGMIVFMTSGSVVRVGA
jgi:exodeoxyribonuclease-5